MKQRIEHRIAMAGPAMARASWSAVVKPYATTAIGFGCTTVNHPLRPSREASM